MPYSCFVKLQKMDIVDQISGLILKRKVSETGTFFTVELQEGNRGQGPAEKTVSALVYWPYTVATAEARSATRIPKCLVRGSVSCRYLTCRQRQRQA